MYLRKKRSIIGLALIGMLSAAAFFFAGIAAIPYFCEIVYASDALNLNSEIEFASAKSYGGLYEDKFESAAYTGDGGFVAAGYTMGDSTDPDWTWHSKTNHAYNDALVVKYDSRHAVEWTWTAEREGVSFFMGVDVLSDGRIVAAGRARDPLASSSVTSLYFVVFHDPSDPSDHTEYFVSGGNQLSGISATPDGGFAVAGYVGSAAEGYLFSSSDDGENYSEKIQIWQPQGGGVSGVAGRLGSGFNGIVMKFDSSLSMTYAVLDNYAITGEGIADPAYSSPKERIQGIAADSRGDLVIVGWINISRSNENAYAAKIDGQTGEFLWRKSAGSADPTEPADSKDNLKAAFISVEALADDSFMITGTTTNDATTEESWKCYGSTDIALARYSSAGDLLYSQAVGTIDGLAGSMTANAGNEFSGARATSDGGCLLFGTANATIYEPDLRDLGFTWGSYGANDGILVKMDSGNHVQWARAYGTSAGDWIYDVLISEDESELLAVGQSIGQYGTPAWTWHRSNAGNPFDAIVMCTNYYEAAFTEPKASSALSDTAWANGTYTGSGQGRGGEMTFEVEIGAGVIRSINCTSQNETPGIYEKTDEYYAAIINRNSLDVDGVSGATLSCQGIKAGVTESVAKAAARTSMSLIDVIAGYDASKTDNAASVTRVMNAISCYEGLTSYERGFVDEEHVNALYAVAELFALEVKIEEEGGGAAYNDGAVHYNHALLDTYFTPQGEYYDAVSGATFARGSLTGAGVTIAVIDSGLVNNSADIDYDRVLPGYDYVKDAPMDRESMVDTNGHGTMVTGILIASQNNDIGIAGLLREAKVVPLRVSASNNSQGSAQLAAAIRDAVDKFGADVITTSLAVPDTQELKNAVDYAVSRRVIITGAAGNSGQAASADDPYIYPASYDDVISVGAVDKNGNVRPNSQKNDRVDVVAPGANIVSLGRSTGGYRCSVKSGTSYSSPVVAALAAALKGKTIAAKASDFLELLKNTSTDKGSEGYDNSYGHGLVDMEAFMNAVAAGEYTVEKIATTIETLPDASMIQEGQSLSDSNLTGGVVTGEGRAVAGTFIWNDDSIKPAVEDDRKTDYEVVFIPEDTESYENAVCKVRLSVVRAPAAVPDLIFNGAEQELVSPGEYQGRTIVYSVTNENREPTEDEYSDAIPTGLNAGTYFVWYKILGDDHHEDSELVSVKSVIAEAVMNVASSGFIGEYDGAEHGINVTAESLEDKATILYGTSNGVYNLDSSPTYRDAGSHTVYYQVTADNYKTVTGFETVAINKAKLYVTADAKSKFYGEADSELTYTVEGIAENDTLEGELVRAEGENVGTYAINRGTLSCGGNYVMKFTPSLLTINKANADFTMPTPNELTYNGTVQELVSMGATEDGTILYSLDGEVYGEEIPAASDAGQYAVYYKVVGDENHQDTEEAFVEVAILQAGLSIAAESGQKEYGDEDPKFSYSAQGLFEGDELVGEPARTKGENAGRYEIQKGTLDAGGNYIISFTGADFIINRKDIGAADVSTKWKSYDYTGYKRQPNVTAELAGRSLVKGQDFKVSYKNNQKVGKASYTVTGIGNYKGTAKGTFNLTAIPVYRLFNRTTGEHFYTIDPVERKAYIRSGWNNEGIAWYAPKKSKTPIYRVSNPNNGNEHHYTKSKKEKDWLVSLGWNDEGVAWYSDDAKTVQVYRHYHPVQRTGNHHYTTSKGESNHIVRNEGWKYEGVSWYAAKLP